MRIQKPIKSIVSATVIAIMSSQSTQAGGFALYTESSASAIGNFAAGIAAEAADASIGWYNPAGLVLIKKEEAVFSGVGVFPSSKLSGTSTFNTTIPDEIIPPYTQSFNGLQGAEDAFVPAFHYVLPLGEQAAFGFSVVSPFGLSTNWGTTSPVRYQATLTKLLTLNVSPELAGKLTENVSVGAGLDFQWAKVNFNSVLGAPAILQAFEEGGALVTPTTYDSTTDNQGHSFGIGLHAGLLSTFNENHTRVGVNYQSKISHKFYGSSTLTGRIADIPDLTDPDAIYRNNQLVSNDVALPDVLTLSAYQDLNAKWALLGSVVYTGWSSFNTIQLNNVAASNLTEQLLIDSTTYENYRNIWRFAVGANYHVNDKWMMRFGGGYDQTPTVAAERDVRLPDADRWALSIGSHYQVKPNIGIDVGYTYLFALHDANVNKTQPFGLTSSVNVNARANVHAQLAGLQVVWAMDKPTVG